MLLLILLRALLVRRAAAKAGCTTGVEPHHAGPFGLKPIMYWQDPYLHSIAVATPSVFHIPIVTSEVTLLWFHELVCEVSLMHLLIVLQKTARAMLSQCGGCCVGDNDIERVG